MDLLLFCLTFSVRKITKTNLKYHSINEGPLNDLQFNVI